MNREQFINHLVDWCKSNKIDLNDVHVSHGGSMLLLNLIGETDDIDLTVTEEIWDRFDDGEYEKINIGMGIDSSMGERYLIRVDEHIDIHLEDSPMDFKRVLYKDDTSGVLYRNPIDTLNDYLWLDRPKDQERIKLLLESFLESFKGKI